jgi:uncharacterized protein YukE
MFSFSSKAVDRKQETLLHSTQQLSASSSNFQGQFHRQFFSRYAEFYSHLFS